MNPVVSLAMFGYLAFVFYLFAQYPPRRAVTVTFIGALLFLPEAFIGLPNPIPAYSKSLVPCYGVLLATAFFHPERFSSFKPSWIDLPMLVWCLCPGMSQITNGLSPISPVLAQIMNWGVPYYLGRIYLNDLVGVRQLAVGIFVGGLIYAPLCLLEMRISPILHLKVYGFLAREDFGQTIRYGGFRPTVFMVHGLWVGIWMMAASLMGVWLWRAKVIKKVWNIQISWLAAAVTGVFLVCKSTGAIVLLVVGIAIMYAAKWYRTALPAWLLILSISFQLYNGVIGNDAKSENNPILTLVNNQLGADRAGSLQFRIDNEIILGEKARQKMVFGWGDAPGSRVYDENGKDISVTDSLRIIIFGWYGAIGIVSWALSMLLPVVSLFVLRYPPSTWSNSTIAPAAMLAIVLALWMIDCLANAMVTPIFPLIAGAISGLVVAPQTARSKGDRSSLRKHSLPQQKRI